MCKNMEQWKQVKDTTAAWCGEAKGAVTGYFGKSEVRTRSQWMTMGLLLFFAGMVLGFLCAPIKGGISIASNNVDSFRETEDED